MGRRRLGRETAFKALYRIDVTGSGLEDAFGAVDDLAAQAGAKGLDDEARRFAHDLLETVAEHRTRLDRTLAAATEHWELERLGAVDRTLLRLGTAEILCWPWIPDEVTIDEYVEIAKKFGTENSGGFVNGILDRARKDLDRPARTPRPFDADSVKEDA